MSLCVSVLMDECTFVIIQLCICVYLPRQAHVNGTSTVWWHYLILIEEVKTLAP